jgi:hypothetical protein
MMPLVIMNRVSVTMMTSVQHCSTFQARRSNAVTAACQATTASATALPGTR